MIEDIRALINYVTTLSKIHGKKVMASSGLNAEGVRHTNVQIGFGSSAVVAFGDEDDISVAWYDDNREAHCEKLKDMGAVYVSD